MFYPAIKRAFDVVIAMVGLIILSPLLLAISILVILESKGGAFYRQVRVGKHGKPFRLYKFRSMRKDAEHKGRLTIGRDSRITVVGSLLRRLKLDELPQLINVLRGDMSLVGPRPEVPEYVNLYNDRQRKVLDIRPGITDLASIKYYDENRLLGESDDPEKLYVQRIMPDKLELNLEYMRTMSLGTDIRIIMRTIGRIFTNE